MMKNKRSKAIQIQATYYLTATFTATCVGMVV